MVFPGVNEAIRYGTEAEVREEITDLAARFDRAAAALQTARGALAAR
jgi:N-acetylated-alpha-linked acidic dipeptidase